MSRPVIYSECDEFVAGRSAMSIPYWKPKIELDESELRVLARLGRVRKLFGFLRRHRHELLSDSFQDELNGVYRQTGAGREPVAPGLMAMAMLMQGYMGVSDAEAVELTVFDLRWQLVLGCLGSTSPAFSQGTFQMFRTRVIRNDLDLRLLERTVELAKESGEFDWKKLPTSLREAADSSPLLGAGRVEDTVNLLGHAARNVVAIAAALSGKSKEEVAREAGAGLLNFGSIKSGLDLQWGEEGSLEEGVTRLVREVESLVEWAVARMRSAELGPAQVVPFKAAVDTVERIKSQNVEPLATSTQGEQFGIRKGVAPDRQVSIEDSEMRHGRKSSSKKFNGYKRHILRDLDTGLIRACTVTPANQPEAGALELMEKDQARQGVEIGSLYIDRGYVDSPVASRLEAEGKLVICRPWGARNSRGGYDKTDFDINLEAMEVRCPGGLAVPIPRLGSVVEFPEEACGPCPLRAECTSRKRGAGRMVRVAEDEPRQQRLRHLLSTPQGRQDLRKRVDVEHGLAHLSQRQGNRARYRGVRNNLFDVRRASAIQNLETIQRSLSEGEYRRTA